MTETNEGKLFGTSNSNEGESEFSFNNCTGGRRLLPVFAFFSPESFLCFFYDFISCVSFSLTFFLGFFSFISSYSSSSESYDYSGSSYLLYYSSSDYESSSTSFSIAAQLFPFLGLDFFISFEGSDSYDSDSDED